MKTRQCPSVLNTKVICPLVTRITRMGQNNAVCYLNLFAVFGVVCGGNTNENENSGKSGTSQDVTPSVRTAGRPTSLRCTNGRFGKMKQQRNNGPMREGLKSWRLQETPTTSAKRKLVLESATDENEPPPKCQTRGLKIKYNSSSIALVHAKSINQVRRSVNLNRM